MKQSLQLRLGQQITMTPQLQQAIRLLQLSTLELQLEIQQALESNIMLEVADEGEYEFDSEENPNLYELNREGGESPLPTSSSSLEEENDHASLLENSNNEEPLEVSDIPQELSVDSGWEDIYESSFPQYDYPNSDLNGRDLINNQNTVPETLQSHLIWQVELSPFSEVDKAIAMAIIDALDNDGYLRIPLEEIAQGLGNYKINIQEAEVVLHRLQHLEPVGVAARSLKECLLVQLEELDSKTPWLKEARLLVSKHLELLGAHDHLQLGKRLKLERDELREVIDLIRSLNPRPGAQLGTHQATYVVPDVFVKRINGQWKVELNTDTSPKLRINSHYLGLLARSKKEGEVQSLKHHLQEARWLIKSLKSRHETLLKVAKCIVKRQTAFLEYGEEAMKPLVLHDIAAELEMHESTISRVTTQKYIHTPRGIFELKYFFSSHVSTNNGGECSSTAIRALIKKLIATENSAKPLSDSKIAKILSERGIKVARRTVAKYREAMVIPPSNERKRLNN